MSGHFAQRLPRVRLGRLLGSVDQHRRHHDRRAARARGPLPAAALGAAADAAPGAVRRRPGLPPRHRGVRRRAGHHHRRRSPAWRRSTRCTSGVRRASTTSGVCTTALCAVMGGDILLDRAKEHLGIDEDETTAGRQDLARAARVQRGLRLRAGDDGQLGVHGQHDPDKADELLDDLLAGEEVASTRGATHHLVARGRARARRLPRRPRRRGPQRRATPRCSACEIARENGWTDGTRQPAPRPPGSSRAAGGGEVTDTADPRPVAANWGDERSWKLADYERHGGYRRAAQGAGA